MVQINFAQKTVTAKVVFYGPGMSGKTTNLEVVHQRAPDQNRGELTSISTDGDRTLFFDFMPLDLGTVAGMRTCFQIYTVPGQVYYNSTRKLVLQGVDGVVFVADSGAGMVEENLESFRNLEENLAEYGKNLASMPHVIQFNKRDLPDAMPVEEMEAQLNKFNAPTFEAVANSGQGVFPTLKAMAAKVLESIHSGSGGGRGGPAPAPPAMEPTVAQPMEAPQPAAAQPMDLPAPVAQQQPAAPMPEQPAAPQPTFAQQVPGVPGGLDPLTQTNFAPAASVPPVQPAVPQPAPPMQQPAVGQTGFHAQPAQPTVPMGEVQQPQPQAPQPMAPQPAAPQPAAPQLELQQQASLGLSSSRPQGAPGQVQQPMQGQAPVAQAQTGFYQQQAVMQAQEQQVQQQQPQGVAQMMQPDAAQVRGQRPVPPSSLEGSRFRPRNPSRPPARPTPATRTKGGGNAVFTGVFVTLALAVGAVLVKVILTFF